MLALSFFLMAVSALSSPVATDYCKGSDTPLPLNDRQHRGMILASTIEDLGEPLVDWEREMTEVAWKVAFFDDGYLDDGQPFQFITTFPSHVSKTYSPVQNIDLELSEDKREAWLDLLRDSKVLIISQIEGAELYNAYCAGVTVVHHSDTHSNMNSTDLSSLQIPFQVAAQTEALHRRIIKVPRGDRMELVKAIDRVATSPTTWLE